MGPDRRDASEPQLARIEEVLESVSDLARGSTVGESARARAENVRSLYRRLQKYYG